jgi:hypothetical protein
MVDEAEGRRREAVFNRAFVKSFGRLKKRGMSPDDAALIAADVAAQATNRTKVPIFDSPEDFAHFSQTVANYLVSGHSYYEVIGEMPFLTTRMIDKVAKAGGTTGVVESMRSEKMSGLLGTLLMAIALPTAGFWYAVVIAFASAILLEIWVQTLMPTVLRRFVARVRLVPLLGLGTTVALIWLGYLWIKSIDSPILFGIGAAVVALLTLTAIPGLTMSILLAVQDRKQVRDFERGLLRKRTSAS